MQKKTIKLVGMIVSFVFALAMIAPAVATWNEDKQTEESTTLLTATVGWVHVSGRTGFMSVRILTQEYATELYLPTASSQEAILERFRTLQPGQQIWFRVKNSDAELWGNLVFVHIRSLQTEDETLFTLEESNQAMGEIMDGRFLGFIISPLFLIAGVVLLVSLFREKGGVYYRPGPEQEARRARQKRMVRRLGAAALLFMAVGMAGIWVMMWPEDKQTEESTTLFTATVGQVQTSEDAYGPTVTIMVQEYPIELCPLASIAGEIPPDRFLALQPGQQIWFRVKNREAEYMKSGQWKKVLFVDIRSLKTETSDIFTLEEGNRAIGEDMVQPRITCAVAMGGFLAGAVALLVSLRREKKRM